MLKSMTAFGRFQTESEGVLYTVEIKSVNNRFLDLTVRLPKRLAYLETGVKPFLQSCGIRRGKVDLTVSEEGGSLQPAYRLDEEAARLYLQALYTLRDTFGLKDDISVSSVAQNTDLFIRTSEKADPEKDWALLSSLLAPCAEAFNRQAESEGERLRADLNEKLDGIESRLAVIEENSALAVSGYRDKLEKRLRTVLRDESIAADENRILTECALFADRVAIDEETVRLRSHLASFRSRMNETDSGEGVGKFLDFTLQEMNRETNTIGSKCADARIAGLVIEIKNEIEKIREQIQNVN